MLYEDNLSPQPPLRSGEGELDRFPPPRFGEGGQGGEVFGWRLSNT
jgi:hypothetical protein